MATTRSHPDGLCKALHCRVQCSCKYTEATRLTCVNDRMRYCRNAWIRTPNKFRYILHVATTGTSRPLIHIGLGPYETTACIAEHTACMHIRSLSSFSAVTTSITHISAACAFITRDRQLSSSNSKRLRADIILRSGTAQQPFSARPGVVRGLRLTTYWSILHVFISDVPYCRDHWIITPTN